jgi:hypothetical protein
VEAARASEQWRFEWEESERWDRGLLNQCGCWSGSGVDGFFLRTIAKHRQFAGASEFSNAGEKRAVSRARCRLPSASRAFHSIFDQIRLVLGVLFFRCSPFLADHLHTKRQALGVRRYQPNIRICTRTCRSTSAFLSHARPHALLVLPVRLLARHDCGLTHFSRPPVLAALDSFLFDLDFRLERQYLPHRCGRQPLFLPRLDAAGALYIQSICHHTLYVCQHACSPSASRVSSPARLSAVFSLACVFVLLTSALPSPV